MENFSEIVWHALRSVKRAPAEKALPLLLVVFRRRDCKLPMKSRNCVPVC